MTSYLEFSRANTPCGAVNSYAAPLHVHLHTGYQPWKADEDSPLQQDAETLARFLMPIHLPPETSVSEVVFGGQARRLKLSLEHAVNLLSERTRLHQRLMADINHRHVQVQEDLFGARLHGKLDGFRRADRIEGMLLQLDEQRRKEELAFWKDTAEVREALFEQAGEYGALRHRTSLLEGLEPGGPAYG